MNELTLPIINQDISLRCIAVEKTVTKKSGEPMLVLQWEVITPSILTTAGEVKVAGLKMREWKVLSGKSIPFTTQMFQALHKYMGLPNFDIDNIDLDVYLGKSIRRLVSTKTEVKKNEATGEPIVNDEGEVVTSVNYELGQILGKGKDS